MEQTLKKIAIDVKDFPVILYMKGNKNLPMCGFSARVVDILKRSGVAFETRDVLQDDTLRQAIKEFSNWPTLPQLYIRGKFIGGCDIVEQLHQTGELQDLLFQ
ncbi:MAG: Grx4 family monothiol glutaredoxin [Candidatus Algichlamydia australiensis]|nr:Grx4 family monothiol glutaredoxin [Chlamydiales bacterium]